MSNEFNFETINKEKLKKYYALFSKPSTPLGEVRFKNTGALISEHYVSSANRILNMSVRPDDVWVISFPRSGTTWAEEMIWLLCNDLNYEKAQSEDLQRRFKFLELVAKSRHFKGIAEFDDINSIDEAPSPRFIKSHLPLELLPTQLLTVKPKIFYIYRNPKDVVVSQFHFFKIIHHYNGSLENFVDLFLLEKMTYQPYWNHLLNFWKQMKSHSNIKLISYEEMSSNLWDVIQNVAVILEKTVKPSEKEKLLNHLSFESMKNNQSINKEEQMLRNKLVSDRKEAQFLRRGLVNQWKEVMNENSIKKFDKWITEHLSSSDFIPFYQY